MKKSLLALLFAVALAVPALAENMWIGGNFNYSNTSPKDGDSLTSFYIEPEFGYNVDEKLDIGIDLGYRYAESAYEDYIEKEKTITIKPFVRYKIFEIGDFAFLAKGSIFYESLKFVEEDVEKTTYGLSIVPVVTYSINETWSISGTLNFAKLAFQHEKCDDWDVDVTSFDFGANNGDLFSIGFSYHF